MLILTLINIIIIVDMFVPPGGKPIGGKPIGGKPIGGKPSGGKPIGGKPARSGRAYVGTWVRRYVGT